MSAISLPGLGLPPIPADIVHLDFEIAPDPCLATSGYLLKPLMNLTANGLDVSISRLLAYSGLHFAAAVDDFWGIGEERARIALAWTILSMWRPRAELRKRDGQWKLVVTRRNNPRVQALVSEILAVGVGIHVARHLYGVPYHLWAPAGLSTYDFSSPPSVGGRILLEVRGRFERHGIPTAVARVQRKFAALRDYRRAMGVIFAPRVTPNTRSADVVLVDPEGEDPRPRPFEAFRDLMKHYAFLFRLQGFQAFTKRLLDLAGGTHDELERYMKDGDDVLKRELSYRTSFSFGGQRFMGTAFDGIMWPAVLTGRKQDTEVGVFFWGVHQDIVNALREGRLKDIAEMKIAEASGREGDFTQILLEDGTALSWAPDLETLLKHP